MAFIPVIDFLHKIRVLPEYSQVVPIPPIDGTQPVFSWQGTADDLSYLIQSLYPYAQYAQAVRSRSTDWADTADAWSRIIAGWGEQSPMGGIKTVNGELVAGDTIQFYADPDAGDAVLKLVLPPSVTGPDGKGPSGSNGTGGGTSIPPTGSGSSATSGGHISECMPTPQLVYVRDFNDFSITKLLLPFLYAVPVNGSDIDLRGATDSQISALDHRYKDNSTLESVTYVANFIALVNGGGIPYSLDGPNFTGSGISGTKTLTGVLANFVLPVTESGQGFGIELDEFNFASITLGSPSTPLGNSTIRLGYSITGCGPVADTLLAIFAGKPFGINIFLSCYAFNTTAVAYSFSFAYDTVVVANRVPDNLGNAYYPAPSIGTGDSGADLRTDFGDPAPCAQLRARNLGHKDFIGFDGVTEAAYTQLNFTFDSCAFGTSANAVIAFNVYEPGVTGTVGTTATVTVPVANTAIWVSYNVSITGTFLSGHEYRVQILSNDAGNYADVEIDNVSGSFS